MKKRPNNNQINGNRIDENYDIEFDNRIFRIVLGMVGLISVVLGIMMMIAGVIGFCALINWMLSIM